MEEIEIALASDAGYFSGLFVTACSIAKYASQDVELKFNILDGGIREEDWQFLRKKIAELHPYVSFNQIVVDETLFSAYPDWHGNKMAYARLLLPDVLKDADWCVYCDVDFSWLQDISELWKMRDTSYALIVTKDGVEETFDIEARWFKQKGLPFNKDEYFCSGLCFINLKMFRELNLISKVFDFLISYPDVHYPDQNALNAVTFGHVKVISQRWQRFPLPLSQADIDRGVTIHHAGDVPWKRMSRRQMLSDAMLIWHKLNAEFRGISVWASLRYYFSAKDIILHRLYCKLFRWRLSRLVLKALIVGIMRHHKVYNNYVQIAAKKVIT